MLGLWICEDLGLNDAEIVRFKALWDSYKDDGIIVAVNVGNESQVNWSDHKCPEDSLISYLDDIKAYIGDTPITTADNWDYWKNQGSNVGDHCDFILTFPLKAGISNSKDFINQQNVGINSHGDRKR